MHAYMHACMCAHIHTYMHTCMYSCMHTHIHACMHTCIHTCIYACLHTCMPACILRDSDSRTYACMRHCASVHVCVCLRLPACVVYSCHLFLTWKDGCCYSHTSGETSNTWRGKGWPRIQCHDLLHRNVGTHLKPHSLKDMCKLALSPSSGEVVIAGPYWGWHQEELEERVSVQ